MKPNKVFLIIASVFLTFGILLGGIYLYVSSTLTPENVRLLVVENLKKTFPKAQVEVGKVDFRFGTSIDFVIEKIIVKKDSPLFSLSDARLKIPVWAILKGGGVVELEVNGPQFNWIHGDNKTSNWEEAMSASASPSAAGKQVDATKKSLILPGFLITSRLNVKMKDTQISYVLSSKEKGELQISKLLIKELGLDNPAAFEIDTSFQFEQEDLGAISAKILLIGEADLHRYISESKISLLSVATVSNIIAPKLTPVALPDLRVELKSEIFKEGAILGNIKSSFKNSTISFSFNRTAKSFELKQLAGQFPTQDLLDILGASIEGLSAGRSSLSLTGEFKSENKKLNPNLTFVLSPGISKSLSSAVNIGLNAKGKLVGKELDMLVEAQTLQGTISTSIKGVLPLESELDLQNLKPIEIDSIATNLNIKKNHIDSFMNDKDNNQEGSSAASLEPGTNSQVSVKSKPLALPFRLNLSIKDSHFEDSTLSGLVSVNVLKTGDINNSLKIDIDKGHYQHNLKANYQKTLWGTINAKFEDFPGQAINPFIPEGNGEIQGKVNGTIESAFKKPLKRIDHKTKFNLVVSNGRIDKINLSDWLGEIIAALGPLSSKVSQAGSKIKIEPGFSQLQTSGTANNDAVVLNKLVIKGNKAKFEIKGKGYLSLVDDKASEVVLDYNDYDGNLSSFLKTEIGTEILPVKLKGEGFSLKPDASYTLKKLSSIFIKKRGVKKIEEEAKKLINDKDKKKLKKLLKGILK